MGILNLGSQAQAHKIACPACGSTTYSTLLAFNGLSFCDQCQKSLVPIPMRLTLNASVEHRCERCDKPADDAPTKPPTTSVQEGFLPGDTRVESEDVEVLKKKLKLMEYKIRKLRLLREEYKGWKNGYADAGLVSAFKEGMETMLNVYDVKITELLND